MVVKHRRQEFSAECKGTSQESADKHAMGVFAVEGVLLVGHLVRICSHTKIEVPGVVRESKQSNGKSEITVEVVPEWRMTPRLPDRT